jgi:alpha-galactosidase
MRKLALVGTDNLELIRKICSDLFGCVDLHGELSVALHDADLERLRVAEQLVRRLDEEAASHAVVQSCVNRRAAVSGADFVIANLDVGGHEASLRDFDAGRRYGLRQTIGDTIGIGGVFRGLRAAPVMLELGQDMSELCPDAWLLSYSDPMAILCWLTYAGTPFRRVVGLCHAARDTEALLADLVGRDLRDVTFLTAGVNHQSFVVTFEADGRSLYPDLDAVIASDPELHRHVRTEMYLRFGFYPTESSEHAAEYVPWILRSDAEVARLGVPVDDYFRRRARQTEEHDRLRARIGAGTNLLARWKRYEISSEIIHSLVTDTTRMVTVSVPNDGLIENLPGWACVEVPATVGASGITAHRIGPLPPQLAALNRTFLNVVELTVRAALDQDRSAVYQAAMLDPNTAATLTLADIEELCDELIQAHATLLASGFATRPRRLQPAPRRSR